MALARRRDEDVSLDVKRPGTRTFSGAPCKRQPAGLGWRAPRRVGRKNRETHAWRIERPLGAIGLEYGRCTREHGRIEADGRGQIMDREIYLPGTHAAFLTLQAKTRRVASEREALADWVNDRYAFEAFQDRPAGA